MVEARANRAAGLGGLLVLVVVASSLGAIPSGGPGGIPSEGAGSSVATAPLGLLEAPGGPANGTEPGFISGVITVGSAQLYLDGYPHYVQPGGGFFIVVQPGTHSLLVVAGGYLPYYNATYVASNETVRLEVNLATSSSNVTADEKPTPSGGTSLAGEVAIGALSVSTGTLGFTTVRLRARTRDPKRRT